MTTSPVTNLFAGLIPGQIQGQTGATNGQAGTSGSSGDAFLALVQGLLDEAVVQPVADPAAEAEAPSIVGAPELTDALATPTDEQTDAPVLDGAEPAIDPAAAAPVVAPFLPQTMQVQPAPAAHGQPMAPAASTPIDAVASVASATVAASTPAAVAAADTAAPAQNATQATVDLPIPGQKTTAALPADGPAKPTGLPAKVALPEVAVSSAASVASDQTSEQSLDQAPDRAAAPAPATATTSTAAPAATQSPAGAPIAAAAPVTATAQAAAPAEPQQVTGQVFPEVVRVVNNPNGPQRVTLKLNPESLGEVRVVLTSRNGGLEVSLTAGAEARQAITEGAPELQRLLDMIGRSDAKIVVRDLAGNPVSQAGGSAGSGLPNDLAGGAGTGTGRPGGDTSADQQSRHQATGSNTNASDGNPGTANPSRPTESGTRGHQGLDVTM